MKRILVLLFLLTTIVLPELVSQPIRFHHISADEESGFGNVWAITEDHEGFIWFGTEDGLYKYDGYEITTYRHDLVDESTISSNFIVSLFEDSHQNLWIGTFGGGLNLFLRDQNAFAHFINDKNDPNSIPHNRVKAITESKDGKIWIATEGGGVAYFEMSDGGYENIKFHSIRSDRENAAGLNSNYIRSLTEGNDGKIYLGTFGGGLNIYDPKTGQFKFFLANETDPNALSGNKIVEVFFDSKGRLWIGTFENGLNLFLPEEERFIHYKASKADTTLNHNEVETITEDQNGYIWVGTDNGLSKLIGSNQHIPQNNFQNYNNEPLDPGSLLSNSIKSLFVDSRNALWVGSYFGGVSIYDKSLQKFSPIRSKPWLDASLTHNNVTAFAECADGCLYIGTDGGGLNRLIGGVNDVYSDRYEYIPIINPITGNEEKKVKTLEMDSLGNLWVGFWAGALYKYNIKSGRYSYYGEKDGKPYDFEARNVLRLKKDQKGNIWIGTFVNGISYYDRNKDEFTTYRPDPTSADSLSSERINAIMVDKNENVWIGGDIGGLNKFNPKTQSFEKIEYGDVLTDETSIFCLMERSNGEIWVGTVSSGVIIYEPAKDTAYNYLEKKGLVNNVIYAMIEDDSGRVWMSTSQGINVYNPHNDNLVSYTKYDGLQSNQFNTGSALKCSNGLLLFGGTKGFNAFYPDSIKQTLQKPKIAFTNFWLSNKLMNTGTPGSPLKSSINSGEKIYLSHDQNSFSVSFATLDYNFSEKNKYAYKLENFDSDWQFVNTDRKAVFTNLDPGEYKLKVRSTNQDGIWFEKERPLLISILPAWWQTLAFKIFLVALMVFLIYLAFRIRFRILLRQRQLLEKEVLVRTQELNESNNQLFEKNNEILAQNEELAAQNEQIVIQREDLENAQQELKSINEKLELTVNQRTEKLSKTIAQLDKTVMELDRFVYSASHDLSAPLKSIRGLIEISKVKNDLENTQECMKYIENSINKLEDVIHSLVEYSRNTHYDIKIETLNISGLIDDVIEEMAYIPEKESVEIINNLPKKLEISSDKSRLKIILNNLIANGIKYSDREKEKSFITISHAENSQHWNIEISDNGIGIDEEYLTKIYNMYFRATEKSKGSGLGLFIVRETLNKINGNIVVNSDKGKGTTFIISLPKDGWNN